MSQQGTKGCFGISWSATDPKCAGGPDPMWTNDDGTHDRPKCDHFNACGAHKMASAQQSQLTQIRMRATQQQQMTQTPQYQQVQPMPTRAVPQAVPQVVPHAVPQAPQQMQQVPSYSYPPPWPNPLQPQMPAPMQMMVQAPMQLPMQQMMPVNFAMPGYLSTPEPYNGSYLGMLGRSILRAMFKAAGHTTANVLDMVPFRMPQQDPEK